MDALIYVTFLIITLVLLAIAFYNPDAAPLPFLLYTLLLTFFVMLTPNFVTHDFCAYDNSTQSFHCITQYESKNSFISGIFIPITVLLGVLILVKTVPNISKL